MAGTNKGLWDQYTDWVMTQVMPTIQPYLEKMPHLGKGLKQFFMVLVMIGMYLSIVLLPIAALFSLFAILGGIRGIISIIVLFAELFGVFASFKAITQKTPRGWEYLIAFSMLGILGNLAGYVVDLVLGHPGRAIGGLIGALIGGFIGLWIDYELKDMFVEKA